MLSGPSDPGNAGIFTRSADLLSECQAGSIDNGHH